MKGKVVVITGALGALGKVVAEEALSRGARVAGIDHAASQLAATAERIELGRIDLTDAAQAKKAIDAAAAHFGAIDALINIAGGFTFETIADGDSKAWQRMYALNVETALNASRAAIPHLLNSRAARIVNIGAMGALQAGSGMGPYAASKAGLHKLTESLAAELKGKITVNAVLPLGHRYRGKPRQHAEGRSCQMGDADGTRRCHPLPGERRRQRRHRRVAAGQRTGLKHAYAATSFRSTARNRMLRLPASAVASHSAPSPS